MARLRPPATWRARGARALAGLGAATVAVASLALPAAAGPQAPPQSMGIVLNRAVPDITLTDQTGAPTSLAAFRGKDVIMAPFLTLCQDECPLITGAFLTLEHDVKAAGLGDKVTFLYVSVDPWRDTPARLTAYAQRFGVDWPMLTGSLPTLTEFWKFFYVYFAQAPEDQPPKDDWWTGAPLTFDVNHTDGFILIDPRGHERFITVDAPNLHGRLSPALTALLNDEGVRNLKHPPKTTWTIPQALAALGWLVGRPIRPAGHTG
jgi:protein SCO1/2